MGDLSAPNTMKQVGGESFIKLFTFERCCRAGAHISNGSYLKCHNELFTNVQAVLNCWPGKFNFVPPFYLRCSFTSSTNNV